MKYIILVILLSLTSLTSANELINKTIDNHYINAIKVEKNKWYKVIVWISDKWESLKSLINKHNWISWINWAYFCPKDYKECNWINNTNADRFSNWTDYSKWKETWPERVIFSIDKNNNTFLFRNWHDYSTWRWDLYLEWKTLNLDKKKDIYNWIWNFPLLLQSWINKTLESKAIDSKMKSISTKRFICSTESWDIIMWSISNIDIYSVSNIIKQIWCYNSINLDSWWSSAMIYNNKYLEWPWRYIMDAFIVIKDENYIKENKYTEFVEKYNEKLIKKYDWNLDKVKQRLSSIVDKINILIESTKKYSVKTVDKLNELKEAILNFM